MRSSILLPAILLGLMVVFCRLFPLNMLCSMAQSLRLLPFFLLFTAIMLGLKFAQSRVVFVATLLGVMIFLVTRACLDDAGVGRCRILVMLSSVYVPIITALFYRMPESGYFSSNGYARIFVVLSALMAFLLFPMLSGDSTHGIGGLCGFPLPGLVAGVVALSLLVIRKKGESRVIGIMFVFFVIFVFGSLSFGLAFWREGSVMPVITFFSAGAGLTLILIALESVWLHAHIDELTQLPGRRAFNSAVAELQGDYCIAMIDIDHFKRINDKYGHQTGDQALRFTASFLQRYSGTGIYRYGGEEFAVIRHGLMDDEECLVFFDGLRESIAGRQFGVRRNRRRRLKAARRAVADESGGDSGLERINITVSIGVARSGSRHGRVQDVVEAADKALYKAKRDGRNMVVVAP